MNDILLPNGPTLVLQGVPLPPCTRFTLPAARERHLSMPEIGEKERDYLFKKLHKLNSNDLMSSLKYQSPLEYPQTHTVLPSLPSQGVPYLRKRSRSPWFRLLAPSAVWLPHSSVNPKPCGTSSWPTSKSPFSPFLPGKVSPAA